MNRAPFSLSDMVNQLGNSQRSGTARTAEHLLSFFESVPDNSGATAMAKGGKFLYGTLEAIEGVGGSFHLNLKSSGVIVTAVFTLIHRPSSLLRPLSPESKSWTMNERRL